MTKNDKTLCSLITVSTITIVSGATRLDNLLSAAIPTGKKMSDLLQVTILGEVTAGTARDAFLYGGSGCLGYTAAGSARILPLRSGNVYLKRSAGSDVTAQVELCWA